MELKIKKKNFNTNPLKSTGISSPSIVILVIINIMTNTMMKMMTTVYP